MFSKKNKNPKTFIQPKIVAVGGGTGLSTMLRGLKLFTPQITAVVTVADDGGGSGILRNDLGMLPPGDIRNCILALANTEPIMEKLLQYRFTEGSLKGQCFGNLFLAAMNGISSSFEEAVKKMSDVLAVTGRVLPVTLEDITLCAELADKTIICGESKIGKHHLQNSSTIKRIFIKPHKPKALPEVIDAILEADIIALGPGSLYTSVIPNLLVDGVVNAIQRSKAIKIYVCNVMTQPGETDGYTLSQHIKAIEDHSKKKIIDFCIANNSRIPIEIEKKYKNDGAELVKIDRQETLKMGIQLEEGSFLTILPNGYIRHDCIKLAKTLIDIYKREICRRTDVLKKEVPGKKAGLANNMG